MIIAVRFLAGGIGSGFTVHSSQNAQYIMVTQIYPTVAKIDQVRRVNLFWAAQYLYEQ